MIPPPPTSTLFPTRRSSDLAARPPGKAKPSVPVGNDDILRSDAAEPVAHTGFLGIDAGRIAFRVARRRSLVASEHQDRKSTRLNSSHSQISYAVFCLKKKRM